MGQKLIEKLWYGQHPLRWVLWPLSCFYQGIACIRRNFLKNFSQSKPSVPVIVVGNITTGGAGKTPLVMALVKACQEKGLRVGVVSRGYGATIKCFPHEVSILDKAGEVGDEPLLIARKCGCPVVIAPRRNEALQYLLDKHQPEIIISDDGLQHYAMGRSLEIIVIDGMRGLGNGLCLPGGPLREGPGRLHKADFLVVNEGEWPHAWSMTLEAGPITSLNTKKTLLPEELPVPIAAMAGIGNPSRFFRTLSNLGLTFKPYIFRDHHQFKKEDLAINEKSVIMTEKDAVKCQEFSASNQYFLPVNASLSDLFWQALWSHEQLKGLNVK